MASWLKRQKDGACDDRAVMYQCARLAPPRRDDNGSSLESDHNEDSDAASLSSTSRTSRSQRRSGRHIRAASRDVFRHISAFKRFGLGPCGDLGRTRAIARTLAIARQLAWQIVGCW